MSRCCNNVYQISEDKGEALERGENSVIDNENLVSIYSDYGEKNNKNEIMCSNCRRVISSEFRYCPYCGEKLR
jgi:hypothetical protein